MILKRKAFYTGTEEIMEIRQATVEDVEGVVALLQANHADNLTEEEKKDGFVTTKMTNEQMEALIEQENGITIAVKDGKVVAFAMAGSWQFWSEWPLFQKMIELLPEFEYNGVVPDMENSYQYGPICVDRSVRGTGVFHDVFMESLRSMKDRYPMMITFINQVNPLSYAAHTRKVRMDEVGTFDFNGNHYWWMACPTDMEC
jgi:hypothetical protein